MLRRRRRRFGAAKRPIGASQVPLKETLKKKLPAMDWVWEDFIQWDKVHRNPSRYQKTQTCLQPHLVDNLHLEPLVDFKSIESPILVETLNSMPDSVLKDLSNDHRIAIGLCKLLVFGVDMDQISHLKMGPVVKSRFVTLEMRVLRLYCNTLDPAPDLQRLVQYLVQVYFPIFLLSRPQYRSFQAPALLLKKTQLCREHLNKGDLDKMQKCLSRNGF